MQKSKIAIVFVVLLVFASISLAGVITGPVVRPANGHSYYLLTNQKWTDSQAEANSLGGDLVTINNATENEWVRSTFSNYDNTLRNLWIGLNDIDVEGTFVWVSGEPVTYTNWHPGNPDNVNNEDYVYMIQTGAWNDGQNGLWGGYDLHGVVEVIPEPATLSLLVLGGVGLITRRRSR